MICRNIINKIVRSVRKYIKPKFTRAYVANDDNREFIIDPNVNSDLDAEDDKPDFYDRKRNLDNNIAAFTTGENID
jgi:hypothetical protein